jgi:hypothetical protein
MNEMKDRKLSVRNSSKSPRRIPGRSSPGRIAFVADAPLGEEPLAIYLDLDQIAFLRAIAAERQFALGILARV